MLNFYLNYDVLYKRLLFIYFVCLFVKEEEEDEAKWDVRKDVE
jgi:hypothetical protein